MDAVLFDNFMQQLNSVVFSDDKLRLLGTCIHNWYDGPQAVAVAAVFANSDDKKKAVAIMNFHLLSISCDDAAEIIRSASFVDDKFAILERLIPKLTDRDQGGEDEIVSAFPFDNDKSKARKVFAAVPASACNPFTSAAVTVSGSPPGGYNQDGVYPPQSASPMYTSQGYPPPVNAMPGFPMLMPQLQGAYPAMTSFYGGGVIPAMAPPSASPFSGYAYPQPSQSLYQPQLMNPSMYAPAPYYPSPGNV